MPSALIMLLWHTGWQRLCGGACTHDSWDHGESASGPADPPETGVGPGGRSVRGPDGAPLAGFAAQHSLQVQTSDRIHLGHGGGGRRRCSWWWWPCITGHSRCCTWTNCWRTSSRYAYPIPSQVNLPSSGQPFSAEAGTKRWKIMTNQRGLVINAIGWHCAAPWRGCIAEARCP